MGIALRRPSPSVERHVDAAADEVWRVLVDTEQWPHWGPSVRRAELRDGGTLLTAGAHGTVWTAVGVALPFRVTDFSEGRSWGWTVAGVPATGHQVMAVVGEPNTRCLVRFTTPWWAAGYLPVCVAALHRIERLVS